MPQESLQTGFPFPPHEKVNNFSSNKILMCTADLKLVTCRKLGPTVLLATLLNLKVIENIFISSSFKFICTNSWQKSRKNCVRRRVRSLHSLDWGKQGLSIPCVCFGHIKHTITHRKKKETMSRNKHQWEYLRYKSWLFKFRVNMLLEAVILPSCVCTITLLYNRQGFWLLYS